MTRIRLTHNCALLALAAGIATPAIAGDVSGFVFDGTDTIALQAVDLRIEELNRRATTERDGSYMFDNVPAGEYTIVANYIGADPVRQTIIVPEDGAVRLDFQLGGGTASILVIGQSANQASALSRKRAADGVSDVLTRDAIGQFPDQNVAESLRRLPGINVLNDQGEGRFVSIRGLDPELNATSLNGVRLPSPESDIRSVALDVISSDIIESIEVKKSLTPDMDGDTIGASIEIETTSAFDRTKDLLTARIEGSYNDLAGALTPKASVDFATRLSDNFGVSGGVSYYRREFETDNIEADDWEDIGNGAFATEVQYRDYDVERERISATLGLDFRAGEDTELYLKGVWSQFDDLELRRRVTFDLGDFDGGASSQTGRTATFSDADEEFTVERDVKDRFERQRIRSLVFGGESNFDNWTAEYSLAYSVATERENGSVDPAQFEQDFDNSGLIVAFDYGDVRRPGFSVLGDTQNFFAPSQYELSDVEFTVLSDSQDEEWAAKFDLSRDYYSDAGVFTVQGGFKGRWRDKRFDADVEFYENDNFFLSDATGEGPTYRLADLSPLPGFTAATDFFNGNRGAFELAAIDSAFDSAVSDYSVEENIIAGYLLGRWETDNLLVISGVRYEHTDNDIRGNRVELLEEIEDDATGNIIREEQVVVTPAQFTRNYGHWLPSINIRYEAQPELIMRLAGYRSIVRPRLSRLAPRFAIEENDEGEREGEFGNPDLGPYEAWNIDATIEYYMTNNGAITAGVFYKDISNYQVDIEVDTPGTFNGIDFDEAIIPINGPSAEIFGFELGVSQSFDFLPGVLSGFILQANYTYTDASGLVPDGSFTDIATADSFRSISLPSTSEHTFNVALGYEKGPISFRVAGTYRDDYLDEVNADGPELDRLVDSHFQLDASAKYRFTDNIQVFWEWVNINDAEFFAYNTLGGTQNNLQYEEYSWTMKFGARVTF